MPYFGSSNSARSNGGDSRKYRRSNASSSDINWEARRKRFSSNLDDAAGRDGLDMAEMGHDSCEVDSLLSTQTEVFQGCTTAIHNADGTLTFQNRNTILEDDEPLQTGAGASQCAGTDKLSVSLLRLNVGGSPFVLRTVQLIKRCPNSFLSKFARFNHDVRLRKSDGFLEDRKEYFFERSAKLFDAVYKYYICGQLHRPMDLCLQEFLDELEYWGIPDEAIAPCCTPIEDEEPPVEMEDPFKGQKNIKQRKYIWGLTEGDGTTLSNIFSLVSIGFVLLSVGGLIVSSLPDCQVLVNRTKVFEEGNVTWTEQRARMDPHPYFNILETFCIVWFTFEYAIRVFAAPARLAFMKEAMNIVDALAIVPFYFELSLELAGFDTDKLEDFKGALLVIRVLRVLRVMRVLKLGRYSAGMRAFALTLKSSAKQLGMMTMVFATGIIFFSTMMYFMEKDEIGTPFTSIPAAFWWCIVTMTTVGYGDVVPTTVVGKLIGSAAIMSGVLVLALPITIIVDNFMKMAGK